MIKADFSKVAVFPKDKPELNRAACEGYSARRGGQPITANRYPVASARGAVWEDAWITADAELKDEGRFTPYLNHWIIADAGLKKAPPEPFAPGAIERYKRPNRLRSWVRILMPPVAVALLVAGVGGLFLALLAPNAPELFVGIVGVMTGAGGWLLTIDWEDQ